jgi:uncharacterized protein involved in exopolysaccharide biosynthesis
MDEHLALSNNGGGNRSYSFTARDVVAIGFRHQRVMILCFIGVVCGVLASSIVLPTKYRAETKLLVKRDRVDPVITPEQNAPLTFHDTVDEEEINSEVELLQSQDVLRRVVTECGLDQKKWISKFIHPGDTPANRTDRAILQLRSDLQLEVIKKSNVISVAYESHNPALAQKVLATLDQAYLDKHLQVHHPGGQLEFFDQEAEKYKTDMMAAEAKLHNFAGEQDGVAPTVLRDLVLQKLAEFNGQLETTRSSIEESKRRIADLEAQEHSTPENLTTQTRTGENAQVMENLKATLLTLENKRTELLTKYQPDYPLVKEVDKEIADTTASLAKEETAPPKEVTVGQNATYSWISGELAKAKADLSGMQAREVTLVKVVEGYKSQARQLEQQAIEQGDLSREAKTDEANYLLYTKKKEEARIDDAMNRNRILNVAVAQAPSLPSLPTRSALIFGLVAVLLAAAVSLGVVFAIDYADQSFRTPSEVLRELSIPVLAAVPVHGGALPGFNGNGHVIDAESGYEITSDSGHGSL